MRAGRVALAVAEPFFADIAGDDTARVVNPTVLASMRRQIFVIVVALLIVLLEL